MDYKLIALDIDGTLTNSQKEITPRTRYALMEAQKQGKKIILASGRHPVGIMPIAKDLMLDRFGGFIMAFNGGRIINCETGETMVSKLFPLEYLPDIVNVLKDSNITINTYDDRRIISDNKVNDYTYVERDVIKAEMVVVDDFISSVRFDINKFFLQANLMSLISIRKFLQTVMTACSMYIKAHLIFLRLCRLVLQKAQCFRLLDKLKIKREELAAFGDNYNDMTMIGYAGFGVAMGNAETDVKKIADYICESNDNDGIANTLDKFVLKQ